MENYLFNLQMFADVSVNLAGADDSKSYLGENGTWYKTLTALNAAGTGLVAARSGDAVNGYTLNIAAGTETNTITVKSTDADALKNYIVTTVASFDTSGGAAVASYETAAITSTVMFKTTSDTVIGTLRGVTTGASADATSTIVFDGTTGGQVTVSTGVIAKDMTASGSAVFQLAADEADQKLVSGTAIIAAGTSKVAKVGTATYTNASADNTATIVVADDTVTLSAGSVKLTADESAIVANGATIVATDAGDGFTVTSAGVVSGLAGADSVVTINGIKYTGTTKTVGETKYSYIVVDGDISGSTGVYTGVTTDNFTNVTLTASSESVTVKDGETALSVAAVTAEDTLAIPAATGVGTRYFAVTYNPATGKLVLADSASTDEEAAAGTTNGVGYFAVTTTSSYGVEKATVVFKSTSKAVSQLNTPVTIDFTALTTSDGNSDLTAIDVSGVSTATKVTGVAASVEANVTGNNGSIGYAPSYTIGTKAIAITAETTKYYALSYSDPGQYGVVTVSIGAAANAAPDEGTAYFAVTYVASPDGETKNYTVTYDTNSDTRATKVNALDWTGIAVDASAVASGKSVTGATGEAGAKYVISAPVGVVITSPSGDVVTPSWSGTPAYEITGNITLSASDNTTKYVVTRTYPANDGNPTYTLASGTPSEGDSYFTVTTVADTKTVTITYTDGKGYGLTGLKSGDTAKKVGVGSTALTSGDWTVDISGAKADFSMASVPAGVTVTGSDTGDTITHTAAYKVGFTLDLAEVTTSPTYFVLSEKAEDAAGYKVVEAEATTTDPTVGGTVTTKSFFTVTKSAEGAVTVAYTEGATSTLDLGAEGTSGKVEIDVGHDTGIKNITVTKPASGQEGIDYHVENATKDIVAIKEGPDAENLSDKTNVAAYVSYDEVNELSTTASENTIALAGIKTDTDTHKKLNYVVTKKSGPTKGVTVYQLALKNTDGYTALDATDSGFILAYDADTKSITMTYQEGTSSPITAATLATLTSKINIDATLAASNTPTVETFNLTEDTEDAAIAYAVTHVPSGVTVGNVTSGVDTVSYDTTWSMGDNDTITLIAPAAADTVQYFAVSATNDKGVREISISSTALDTGDKTGTALAEYLAQNAPQGYYKVTTEKTGAVTVAYVKGEIDPVALDGRTVKVVANANTTKTATITLVTEADTAVNYAVSGLTYGQTVDASDTYSTASSTTYLPSYAMAAGSIPALTLNDTLGTTYFTITAGAADASNHVEYTVASATEGTKGSHYFVVKNAEYGTTVTYVNADSAAAYNLAAMGLTVQIEANGLGNTRTVTTLDMSDSTTKVNYALTNVASTIKVTGTDDDDTVAYKVVPTLAEGQKITVGTGTTYWVVAKDESASTDKKTVVTVSQYTGESKPTNAMNYFTVTNTAGTVVMTYTPATDGDAYNLAAAGTITVDAANATNATATGSLAVASGAVGYDVVNLAGGATVTNVATTDSISYTSTFAWPTVAGTYKYYVKADAESVTAGDSMTSVKGDTTAYDVITVTVSEDSVTSISLATNTVAATGTAGAWADVTTAALPATINVASTVTTLDATNIGTGITIAGLAADATVTNLQSGAIVTTAALAAGKEVKISAGAAANAVTYVSGAADNAITVTNKSGLKVTSGVLVLGEGVTLTGSKDAGTDVAVSAALTTTGKGDKQVVLTFEGGEITSITGLEAGEVLDVTINTTSYQYTYDATKHLVTKIASGGGTTYAGANDATVNILAATYTENDTAITGVGTFAWDGSKYVLADSNGTTTVVAGTGTGSVTKDGVYVIAKATTADPQVLTLQPAIGNAGGLLDETDTYAGTINVTATDKKVSYDKGANKTYTVTVTGAANGSAFTNMDQAGDAVTSGTLANGNTIAYNGSTYTVSKGTGDTGVLEFKTTVSATTTPAAAAKGGLYAGKITVATSAMSLSDGSTVVGSASTVVTVDDGAIATIQGLSDSNETITLTSADGTVTVYKNTSSGSAYTVEKTVTATDGSKTVTTLTFASAEALAANILGDSEEGTPTFTNNFGFDSVTTTFGYFVASGDPLMATVAADTSTVVKPDATKVYIMAENAYDSTATIKNTLTLTAKVWDATNKKFKDVDGEATKVTASVTCGTGNVSYTAGTKEFKVAFTAAKAGSVFYDLTQGDTVTTTSAITGKITVNGTEFAAAESSVLAAYAENKTDVYITNGIVTVDGSIKSSTSTGETKQTLVYETDGTTKDGVKVTYANGVINSITDLEAGETVTVTTTTGTTTYAATSDGSYVYQTNESGTVTYEALTNSTNVVAAGTYDTVSAATSSKFQWVDTSEGAADVITGFFAQDATAKTATVANQSTAVSIDYQNYKETYVYASYIRSTGALTLTKGAVAASGTPAHADALASGDKITLTVADAAKVTYTKGSETSLAITGVGHKSAFTGLTAVDSVTTAALAADKTVTVNGHDYTTGKAGDTLEIVGIAGSADALVTSGTFRLGNVTTASANTIKASVVDDDKNTTVTTVTNTVATDKDGVVVTVAEGLVTGLTDLEAGETVTINKVVTDKLGNETTTIYKYEADAGSGSKAGQIVVTRTNVGTGEVSTHTFTSNTQDVLADSVVWTITEAVTTTKFDWNATEAGATGYFLATTADEGKTYTVATVATQGSATEITKDDKGKYYLKVEASKALSGLVTVSGMTLMQVTDTGEFEAVTGKTLNPVSITAPEGGLALPEHTFDVNITGAPEGVSYTGLNDDDTVAGQFTLADKTISVNGTTYTAGADTSDFKITGANTVTDGTMKLVEATPSLKDTKNGSTVAYTKGTTADGVIVTVTAAGGVTSITDLADTEKVEVTDADGNKAAYTSASTGTVITKTLTNTDGSMEVWNKTITAGQNVVVTGYGIKNAFNWGVEKTGVTAAQARVGYYSIGTDATTNVAVNTTATPVTPATPGSGHNYYLRVVSNGNATDGYTISSIKVLEDATLTDVTATTGANAKLTITAPTDGSLTIAANAVALADDASERSMTINVTGAVAGATYTGLLDTDTVSAATLASNDQITVGTKVWTAAQSTSASFTGDGKAIEGTFKLDASNTELVAYKSGTAQTTTVTRGDTTDARITFGDGAVTDIRYITAGEIVTVVESTSAGTTTTVYTAETVDGALVITKEVTDKDGVTTTWTAPSDGDSANIVSLSYTEQGKTVSSEFNWTAANGTGYFEVTPTTDENGAITGIGTVAIDAQDEKTTLESGKYYLKVALTADGAVSGIGLVQMTADGVGSDLMANTIEGTLNVTAPAKALTLDASVAKLTKVAVNITGAVADSVITLKTGDTLRTVATMGADDTIRVNGKTFTAAGTGTLRFYGAGLLSNGAVKMSSTFTTFQATGADDDASTAADNVTLTLSGMTTETPVVTVKNGVVASVSDLGDATLTVGENGWSAAYTAAGLTLTTGGATAGTTFTSLKLAAGNTVNLGTTATTYEIAADGTVALAKSESGAVTVQSGTLILAAGDTLATANENVTGVTAAGVTVVVANGKVTSVKGLAQGESLKIGTTTYTATTANSITKKEDGSTETATAAITAGGDILAAKYVGGGTTIDTEENVLEGQFTWSDTSNEASKRSVGYFLMKETTAGVKTATIAEQSAKVAVAVPTKSGVVNKYLVGNVNEGVLTISAFSVNTSGETTSLLTSGADAAFTEDDRITITAPTTTNITYDKGAALFAVTVNKLAANSEISGLDTGDKVVTNTLEADETVTINDAAYIAGAKNVLTFLGEGNGTAAPATNGNAALLSGTIKLAAGESARLVGTSEKLDTGSSADDVIVAVASDGTDEVVVKVANGVVTSVTGLVTEGATVTITPSNGTGTPVVYTAINDGGTMISRKEGDGAAVYKAVTSGKEIYDAKGSSYKEWATTEAAGFDWSASAKQLAYIALGTDFTATAEKTFAQTGVDGVTSDVITESFNAVQENYYLRVTATTKAGTATISAVDLMQAGATGTLTAVKSTVASYYGKLTIDGATLKVATEATDGKVVFKLPTTKTWTLAATNVAIGSVFTNLKDGDTVATADAADKTLEKGTYELYSKVTKADGVTEATAVEKVTVTGNGVTATVAGGHITALSGLYTKGETVTIVNDTANAGLETTVYKMIADGKVQRTVTTAAGLVTVNTANVAMDDDVISEDAWSEEVASQVVSDFNWTMDKATTGYFAISTKGEATAKTAKTTITEKNKNTSYVAVALGADGVVSSIKQVSFNTTTGEMDEASAGSFTGTLTITAPTAYALSLNRTAAFDTPNDSMSESAELVIKGAIENSTLENLAEGDTVTTAKLDKGDSVTVNDTVFTAGTANAMTVTMQEVDEKLQATLTAGTARILNGGFAYVGDTLIEVTKGTSVTVTASTRKVSGVSTTSYTIGEMSEGTQFTVETFGSGAATTTYTKNGTTLFKTVNNASDSGTTNYVYALGTKTSVTSAILDGTNWKAVTAALTEVDGTKTSNFGAVTVDLATLDKRITADTKAYGATAVAGHTYDFVIDQYVDANTRANAALTATVANDANLQDLQTVVGQVVASTSTYNATDAGTDKNNVAQTIKAAKDWNVTGSAGDDIITGASANSKGVTTTLAGGAGNDTITGGGATENFVVGNGADVLKSYATGKDSVTFDTDDDGDGDGDDNFLVKLDGKALDTTGKALSGVLLYKDDDDDGVYSAAGDTNSVLLTGMGNGKAVNINGSNYYFGDGTKKTGKASFTFEEGAYYYGNDALETTLKVTTDKTKATKTTIGDTVNVDLSDTAHYHEIDAVDAASSGNSVKLTAASTGSTLKGGSYLSTLVGGAASDSLVGGSGVDTFWFEEYEGDDTVQNFANGKDKLYLAKGADNFKVSGSDVVFSDSTGDNSVTLQKMANSKAVAISTDGENYTNYFFNQSGKANNYTGIANAADVFVVNGAKSTAIKNFEVGDAIKLYVGAGSDFDIDSITLSSSKGTTKTYSMGGQTVAINDSTYGTISDSNTTVSAVDAKGYVTITRKEEA